MRRPSHRIASNTVTITPVASWTQDASGARAPVVGIPSGAIRCRVHPSSTKDVPEQLREAEVEYLTVHFFEDRGVRARDTVTWLDPCPARILTARGPARISSGAMRTYLVDCEHRPSKRGT